MDKKIPRSNNDNENDVLDIEKQIKESESEQQDSDNISMKPMSEVPKIDQSLQSRITELETLLKEKDEEILKGKNQYLRAMADYDNLSKRAKSEKARIIKNANENILSKFLELADSFDKGRNMIETEEFSLKSYKESFLAIEKQFFSILKGEGVEKIKSLGEKFDPAFHEVILVRSDPDNKENTIIEEIQTGYLQNSKLIRPSKVIISKK